MRSPSAHIASRAGRRLTLAVLAALAAAAVGAYALTVAHRRPRPFALQAMPTRLTVAPGSSARYLIEIRRRRHLAGRVLFRVRGLPPHAWARFSFARHSRSRVRLIVRTAADSPTRGYRLRVRGSSGRVRASLTLRLTLAWPPAAHFTLAGNLGAPLQPGSRQPLDLALGNPGRRPISVTSLRIAVRAIDAPGATQAQPCGPADFEIQQYMGPYPLTIAARSTRTLAGLGVAPAYWPQVAMLDRPVDQDGCQRATITLSYSGTASGR